jgi:hypothetical protein
MTVYSKSDVATFLKSLDLNMISDFFTDDFSSCEYVSAKDIHSWIIRSFGESGSGLFRVIEFNVSAQ